MRCIRRSPLRKLFVGLVLAVVVGGAGRSAQAAPVGGPGAASGLFAAAWQWVEHAWQDFGFSRSWLGKAGGGRSPSPATAKSGGGTAASGGAGAAATTPAPPGAPGTGTAGDSNMGLDPNG
ncbi:MAG TPA: hypothetical protein VHQ90_03315 [Thermoanaerobaculia bacterium]|nr:hypothetical protein [Thermoanaerobaculia bacterium]